jgi:hypothetical protein
MYNENVIFHVNDPCNFRTIQSQTNDTIFYYIIKYLYETFFSKILRLLNIWMFKVKCDILYKILECIYFEKNKDRF